MSDDRDVAAIATLLADECTRLDEFGEHDLIVERLQLDADGHHYKVYSATLDRVAISLTDEGFDCRLTRRERMADRFTQFVEEM
ncbi:transcriptional regulator [Halobacteriales archaeon QS_8_65_32]|nr:MAG: transcriptional regulator [Halobacteriales archaeon QS_8_65_32]